MAENFASGRFTTATTTGVVTEISGLGFTPTLIILRASNNTVLDTQQVRLCRSMSVWTASTAMSHTLQADDGSLGSRYRIVNGDGDGLNIRADGGGVGVQASVQLSGNDVQLDYTSADGTAYEVYYEIYGGTVNISIDSVSGTQTGVTVGFQPSLVLAWNPATTNTTGSAENFSEHGYGFSDGTTTRSNILDVHYSGWYDILNGQMAFGDVSEDIENLAFTPTGFTFDSVDFQGIDFITIGFSDRSVVVGEIVKETTGVEPTNQNMTSLGFNPDYIHFFSASRNALDDNTTVSGSTRGELSFGMANGTIQGGFVNNKNGGWDALSYTMSTSCISMGDDVNPDDARGTIGSLATNTPTITWNPNNTTPYRVGYYAIGPDAASLDTLTPQDSTQESTAISANASRVLSPQNSLSESSAIEHSIATSGAVTPQDSAAGSSSIGASISRALVPQVSTAQSEAIDHVISRVLSPQVSGGDSASIGASLSLVIAPQASSAESLAIEASVVISGALSPQDSATESASIELLISRTLAPQGSIAQSSATPIAVLRALAPQPSIAGSIAIAASIAMALAPQSSAAESAAIEANVQISGTLSPQNSLAESAAIEGSVALAQILSPQDSSGASAAIEADIQLQGTLSPKNSSPESEAIEPQLSRALAPQSSASESSAIEASLSIGLTPEISAPQSAAIPFSISRILAPQDSPPNSIAIESEVSVQLIPQDSAVQSSAIEASFDRTISPQDSVAQSSATEATIFVTGSLIPQDSTGESSAVETRIYLGVIGNNDIASRDIRFVQSSRSILQVNESRNIIMACNKFTMTIGDTRPALEDLFYYAPNADGEPYQVIDDIELSEISSVVLRFILPGDPTVYQRNATPIYTTTLGARYQWQGTDTESLQSGPLKYNWVVTLNDGSEFRPGSTSGPGYVFLKKAI